MSTWIDHFGHTSFGVTRGTLKLLIDPILVRQDLDFRRPTCPRWLFDDLGSVSAVFISHGHNDHFHPPSMLGLPQDTPVYFLDESPESCSCDVSPRELLRELGFRKVHPVRPGEVIALAEDVKVHILPAQKSSEGEEQCCFLVESPDVLMFDGVDARDTAVTRKALEPFLRKVDVAFVPTGASLQFQGFWNQMDAVAALAFCKWLQPAKVASCGGSVSLAERPRPGTLERYPNDLADWLATAAVHLGAGQLVSQRPPYRMSYEAHRLRRCTPLQPASRFQPHPGAPRPQALLTTFFTGYHPQLPTKRWSWPQERLEEWLRPLEAVRDVVQGSPGDLRALVMRCTPASNRTPAAVLAPCAMRRLVEGGALELAARDSALIPRDPADLDTSFFAALEALVENATGPSEPLLPELRTCLFIDRRMLELRRVSLQLKALASYPEGTAEGLRAEHIELLQETIDGRRPLLGPNHFRLTREQAPLLTGKPLPAEAAELLCYAGLGGVHQDALSSLESLLVNLCDGRTFAEMVTELAEGLDLPQAEVHASVFNFFARLSRNSVVLIDWSQ